MKKIISISIFTAVLAFAGQAARAHQPRLVEGPVTVEAPEVSKAYYGELAGQPAEFRIESSENFKLYLGLLVPDSSGTRTDISLLLARDVAPVVVLDGKTSAWTPFHEEFANDDYLKGPEYRLDAGPGTYVVSVHSYDNRGKYVLVIGEKEEFPPTEMINSLRIIPKLKRDFFGKSPADFALSVIGGIVLAVSFTAGILIGLLYRLTSRRLFRSKVRILARNIGRPDRLGRSVLVLVLLMAGIAFWSVPLMIAAGFVLFEAAAGWCALNQALGRNTCPIA